MISRFDDKLPEERQPEYEELTEMLRQAYHTPVQVSSERQAQALARARERLGFTASERTNMPPALPEGPSMDVTHPASPGMDDWPEPRQHGFSRLVSLIAAVLVVGVLIVSSLLIFQVRHPTPATETGAGAGTPTPAIGTGIVPDLRGLTYISAQSKATQAGFKLQLSGTSTEGIVADQNPGAGARYKEGNPIVVTMTTRTTVPTYKQGATLVQVEQAILAAHLQYQVKPDKNDPTLPANTVSRLDPASGTTVQINTMVTIYVTNLNGLAPPVLAASPGTLTFTQATGSSTQSITVSNTGGEPLNWRAALASNAPSDVTISSATSGTLAAGAQTTVTITVDTTNVPGGTNASTNVTISAIDPIMKAATAGSPATVTIAISTPAPAMQLSGNTLTFTTTAGTNPVLQTMTITNNGGNGLTWTVGAPSQTWLIVSPTSGSDAATLKFTVDVTGLATGTYQATVTITPSAGAAVTVRVNLTVN